MSNRRRRDSPSPTPEHRGRTPAFDGAAAPAATPAGASSGTPQASTARSPTVLRVRSPEDLLAAIPCLLGFHPSESLVMVGLAGSRRRTVVTSRVDLPAFARAGAGREQERGEADPAASLGNVAQQAGATEALLVAYTAGSAAAEPALRVTLSELTDRGVEVPLAGRADGERWWELSREEVPSDPGEPGDRADSGPAGVPYDLSSNPLTSQAVYEGRVILPSREDLRSSVAADPDAERAGVAEAVARIERSGPTPDPLVPSDQRRALKALVRILDSGVEDPDSLSDERIAELSVLVADRRLRDVAWMRIDRARVVRHLELWQAVLRRVVPPYELAPANLAAFAAWYSGRGALAWCALDRALRVDPDDSMTVLLADLLTAGIPPSAWDRTPGPPLATGGTEWDETGLGAA